MDRGIGGSFAVGVEKLHQYAVLFMHIKTEKLLPCTTESCEASVPSDLNFMWSSKQCRYAPKCSHNSLEASSTSISWDQPIIAKEDSNLSHLFLKHRGYTVMVL